MDSQEDKTTVDEGVESDGVEEDREGSRLEDEGDDSQAGGGERCEDEENVQEDGGEDEPEEEEEAREEVRVAGGGGQDQEEDEEEEMSFNVEEGNQDDEESRDPVEADKVEFEDEGQSLDQFSIRSDERSRQSGKDDGESRDLQDVSDVSNDKPDNNQGDKDKDDNSKDVNAESVPEPEVLYEDKDEDNTEDKDASAYKDGEINLQCDEPLQDDDGEDYSEAENVVAEVDISSMMEMNMEEGDENSQSNIINTDNQSEPEVIPIDSDDETTDDKAKESRNESQPVPLNIDQSIFEVEDDDDNCVTVVDAFDVMQFEVTIEDDADKSQDVRTGSSDTPPASSSSSSTISRRPRRAAAEAAAKTIHQISAQEQGEPPRIFRSRRKSQEDSDFSVDMYRTESQPQHPSQPQSLSGKQRCHVCRKAAICSIVVKQFGSDLYLCSNTCFNRFRNQGKEYRNKSLPCCKCGVMSEENQGVPSTVYFWETMNFCSDLCVGRYQMDVGSKCCTCGKSVPWGSLGKYCVRFGSDIRQFCTPPCLEGYKKNARVCFNCQLDIRRIGNVILANIPSKSTPKEFCSNECVDMYCDRNLHQPTRAKPQPEHVCCICQIKKPVHKELVLQSANYKTCSENCWQDAVSEKGVAKPEKCEMCSKFVSMDLGFTTPVFWLSSLSKVYGFCSHICKNLFILNSRRILSCTSCKVKKYNFDLIEFYTNSKSVYAVCSLACLPKQQDYLKKLREVIYIPQPISDKTTPSALTVSRQSRPVITSVASTSTSMSNTRQRRQRKEQQLQMDEEIQVLDELDDVDIGDPESFLDNISVEFLDSLLEYVSKRPPDMRSKACSAKPRTRTVETQTDISELNDMERVQLVADEVVHYIPVPIPCLINVPFPGYFLESPAPIPFPMPIPVPIPIPVIISTEKKETPDGNKDTEPEPDKGAAVPVNTEPTIQQNGELNSTKSKNKETADVGNPASEMSQGSITFTSLKSLTELTSEIGNTSPTIKPTGDTSLKSLTELTSEIGNISPTVKPTGHQDLTSSTNPVTKSPQNTFQSSACPQVPVVNSPTYISPPVLDFPSPVISPQVVPSYSYNTNSTGNGSYSATSSGFSSSCYSSPMTSPVVPVPGYNTHSPTASYMDTPPPPMPPMIPQAPPSSKNKVEFALRAWKLMFGPPSDPRSVSSLELSSKLSDIVNRGSKQNGEKYRADHVLYISLGIQQLLRDNSRVDKIFYDNVYYNFVLAFTEFAERELAVGYHASVEEIHFWEASELGATSPGVLLFTLIYMFYKYFGLKTWEMHSSLQFSHIAIQSRYDQFGRSLRYLSVIGLPGAITTEIPENVNCPERCFIKVYEFYRMMSESPNGPFYKCLRQDYTPRTPWFTSQPLDQLHIYQMLVRAAMIRSSSIS